MVNTHRVVGNVMVMTNTYIVGISESGLNKCL